MKNILLLITIFSLQPAICQVARDSALFKQLKDRDSLLFELGFNECKIAEFEYFISNDLEFYHDQAGLSSSKEDFLGAIRNNICSNPKKKPIRRLKENNLKVFPLYENGRLYGAIQKGEHDFYIREPGKDIYKTSSARFTHIWILEKDEWILKRVLSYDHQISQ